jgi:HD-GYP domain-containing protein (c-di-GMP phosphodiesterase class II)
MVIDAHRIAGNERNTSAATEGGVPGNVGQHGELPARFAAATKMLVDTASAESVVATIGRALLFLTEAEHAAIFFRSPTGLVTCPWSHNLSNTYVGELVTPKDANPWMHILRYPEISCMDLPKTKRQTSSTPWFLPDVLALSSDHERLINRIVREGLRSMCAWPLTRAGRVTAAFVYCYDSPHLYSQDEQGFMAAFASQAAAALQAPGAPTDSQAAFGVKTTGSVPKLQIIDAAEPLVADMHRATGDEQARGEIEAARAELSEAQRQLEAEQARLTADRTSFEADSRHFAQAQAALAAETERLGEARQALTLEADQLAAARGQLETERAQLVETQARLAAAEGQMVRVDAAAVETEQARLAARRSESDAREAHLSQERAAFAAERAQITAALEAETVRLAREREELETGRLQLAEAQARLKAAEVELGRDKQALAVAEASVSAARQELEKKQARAPRTGALEAGTSEEPRSEDSRVVDSFGAPTPGAGRTTYLMLVERAGVKATPDVDGQIAAVSGLLDAHVGHAKGHSQRLAGWAEAIARALAAPEPEVRAVRRAALLHDIGKVDVPQTTLQKASGLTADEQALLDREAAVAHQILKDVQGLDAVSAILQHRFEHWNGAGHPGGLKGDAIPLGARILAIVGAYSEMLAGRPGVPQLYYRDAIAAIKGGSGKRFDPKIVTGFSKIVASG